MAKWTCEKHGEYEGDFCTLCAREAVTDDDWWNGNLPEIRAAALESLRSECARLTKELDAALATAQARDEEAGRLRNLLLHAVTYIAPAKDFGPMMEGPCSVCNAMISKFECEAAFLCSECLTRQIDAALGSPR